MGQRVLIRCDGSPKLGLGHALRCLVVADELRERHGCEVSFAVKEGPLASQLIEQRGYAANAMSCEPIGLDHEESWLKAIAKRIKPAVLVLDIRTELSRKAIEDIRLSGIAIVTLDDASERRLSSDLAIYPPVPQVEQLDWSEFTGIRHAGWEWVLIRPEFAFYRQQCLEKQYPAIPVSDKPTVLITMGGSDPAGLTLKSIQSIDALNEEFNTVVILGSGFEKHAAIDQWVKTAKRNYEILVNVKNMPKAMSKSDLAVVSFGVSAYELAALGIPSIHLCLSDDHAKSSSQFVKAGMAKSLGNHADVSLNDIASAVRQLLLDRSERQLMRKCCLAQPIGDGYRLTATAIADAIHNNHKPIALRSCF